MTKKILSALLAALALGVGAVPAAAAPFTPMEELAYAAGIEYWGQPADCGSVEKTVVSAAWLAAEHDGELALAAATQPKEGEYVPICELDLSAEPYVYSGHSESGWDFSLLCRVVAHEVGHLTGHGHVDDPASLMYSGEVTATTPQCEHLTEIRDVAAKIAERRYTERTACKASEVGSEAPCWSHPAHWARVLHRLQREFWTPLIGAA